MFAATEESLSSGRDPSLRSGRHVAYMSSYFEKAVLINSADNFRKVDVKRRIDDAVLGDDAAKQAVRCDRCADLRDQ